MDVYTLDMEKRTAGKKGLYSARKNGLIPIVIYGKEIKENITGFIKRNEFVKILHSSKGKNALINLNVEGQQYLVLPYDLQIHPVKDNIIHVDFLNVKEDEEVVVTVPVKKVGRSKGEIAGGKLFQVIKELKVKCLPKDIPDAIVVDVSPYKIGARIKIEDIEYPEGVRPVYKKNVPVIVINKGRGMTTQDTEEDQQEA